MDYTMTTTRMSLLCLLKENCYDPRQIPVSVPKTKLLEFLPIHPLQVTTDLIDKLKCDVIHQTGDHQTDGFTIIREDQSHHGQLKARDMTVDLKIAHPMQKGLTIHINDCQTMIANNRCPLWDTIATTLT